MRAIRYFPYFLFAVISLSRTGNLDGNDGCRVLTENGKPIPYSGCEPARTILIPNIYKPRADEFRGIWITTVWNLDFPAHKDVKTFKNDFAASLAKIRAAGFTAVFFQVRPMNDAFYPSKINPWSRFLTGKEGMPLDKGFDPLEYMIRTTHAAGLEFHAWLNPYRVSAGISTGTKEYLATLDKNNFAVRKPHLVLATPNKNGKKALMLNPGEPEVILFLTDTVRELIEKYDLDGIHFDDYFYPYDDMGNSDSATYVKYAKGVPLDDWRRSNVDKLILSIHKLIEKNNQQNGKNIRFGISPFGIWANMPTEKPMDPEALKKWSKTPTHPLGSPTKGAQSYHQQYADTRKWVKNEWLDYIVPQLYWGFSNRHCGYAAITDWWSDVVEGTNVDLYMGMSAAKCGVSYDMMRAEELSDQLLYNTSRSSVKGVVFFSYRSVFTPENKIMKKAVRTVIEQYWYGKIK